MSAAERSERASTGRAWCTRSRPRSMSSSRRSIRPSVKARSVSPAPNGTRICWRCCGRVPSGRPVRQWELLRAQRAAQDHRRRMAGVGDHELVLSRVEHQVDERHQLFAAVLREHEIEVAHDDLRCGVHRGVGAYGRPHLRHRRCRRDPSPHDIPDEDGKAVLAKGDRVVEVTADVGAPGRAVVVRDLPVRQRRHGVGQHCPLQLDGRRQRLAVQLGIVDGEGRAPGQVLGEREIVGTVEPLGLSRYPGEHAEGLASGDERHRHGAAQVQVAGDVQLLLVDSAGHEHLVGDLADELASAGTDHTPRAAGCVRVRGVAVLQREGELDLRRVHVLHGHTVESAALDHVDRTPVGKPRHRQPRHPDEGCLVVQAAGQLRRRVGEELELGGLRGRLVHVADAVQRLGARVSHDLEELELGGVHGPQPGERQPDHTDRARRDPQG